MMKLNLLDLGVFLSSVSTVYATSCRFLPGDLLWPAEFEWKLLNLTVGGRLIKTVPLGSPCHDPTYDAAKCTDYQSKWQFAPIQYVKHHNQMSTPFD